jgi:hypothetical protein
MKKSILNNALLLGGVSALIFLIIYFIKPELNFNLGIGFITSLLIPIYFIRKGILEEREENEGNITFGEGLAVAFPIYLIGSLLINLATFSVLQVDTEYKNMGEKISLDMSIKALEKTFDFMKVPEEEQVKAFEEIKLNPPKITLSTLMIGFLGSLIFPGLILCLIMAGVLKRK